jgi:hypothetical protein
MNSSTASPRRRHQARLCPELLEARTLMTGGVGDTFALIPGTITAPGGSAVIPFTINPANFTLPKGKMTIGIEVVPTTGSSVTPLITAVKDSSGHLVSQAFSSIYNPHLSPGQVAKGAATRAVLAPVTMKDHQPTTYNVTVSGLNHTSGNFLVGFYLPGDADGDGVVTSADLQLIRASMNSRSGQSRYNFNADANRDGRIGRIDLAFAEENLGVSTTIAPVISASLDPATMMDLTNRITNSPTIHITGTGSAGAPISFTNTTTGAPAVTTTTDASGNYSVNIPLAPGANTITATTTDSFGQTISGPLSPITYSTTAAATPTAVTIPATTASPTTGSSSSSNQAT